MLCSEQMETIWHGVKRAHGHAAWVSLLLQVAAWVSLLLQVASAIQHSPDLISAFCLMVWVLGKKIQSPRNACE